MSVQSGCDLGVPLDRGPQLSSAPMSIEVRLHHIAPIPPEHERLRSEERRARKDQRQQRMSEARRELVLDAARSAFAEHGIEGANIREIARRAGYTAGALYSYFDNKEAIYAALLEESLERLGRAVLEAKAPIKGRTDRLLLARAQAWFAFYAAHPRDLDLGFYLVRGVASRGLTADLNRHLDGRLREALQPCEDALVAMGLDAESARREHTALFAHGLGLLLLQHTGRIRLFGAAVDDLFTHYVEQLVLRTLPPAEVAADAQAPVGQGDLFSAP
jgi:AcrR family transcriptional regulator